MIAALRHVDDWIFDLDNTLYPASARLFDLIDERMGAYRRPPAGLRPGRGAAASRSNISATTERPWPG